MKQSTSKGERAWFWVGVVLLSISALWVLWWLVLILASEDIGDIGYTILAGVVTTIIPIGAGVYCMRRGRKAPGVEIRQSPESAYASEPTVKLAQGVELGLEHPYESEPTVEPVQPYRRLLGCLKEKLRDKTRDRLCADLCAIGVNARMAERGRPEERIGENWKGKSQGLIEIRDSPIHWVNVLKEKTGGSPEGGAGSLYTNVYLVFGSTEHGVRSDGYIELGFVRAKDVSLFGKVVDVQWKVYFIKTKGFSVSGRVSGDRWASDVERNVIRRLEGDVSLKESLIELNEDVVMRSFPEYGCWALISKRYLISSFRALRQSHPSREQWNCYETIARHLLESSRK